MTDMTQEMTTRTQEEIESWMQSYIGNLLSQAPEDIQLSLPLDAFALDSVNIVRMAGELEDLLQIEVESSLIYEYECLQAFCHQLERMHRGSHAREMESGEALGINIVASFTAEPVEESLVHWLRTLGYKPSIRFAGYNQVFQEMLNPASSLVRDPEGIGVILCRIEDSFRFETDRVESEAAGRMTENFIEALQTCAARNPGTLVLALCPHSSQQVRKLGLSDCLDSLDAKILEAAEVLSNVVALDLRDMSSRYQLPRVLDEARDQLGHIPFTQACFGSLGTEIARVCMNLRMPPKKVVVLDCDQTLWQGVVGEDGPLGIKLSAPFLAMQRFMLQQREQGKLLCLASKNNEADVMEVFDLRPDMVLSSDDFIATRINWNRKSQSLQELAAELNLGLDSFIFVDDNSAECEEVALAHPEVTVIRVPENPEQIPSLLAHHWAFDSLVVTREDRKRTELYRSNLAREALRETSSSFEEFLATLNVQTQIQSLNSEQVARAAQLTHRTNQFNATTIRRNEHEIQSLMERPECLSASVQVADRFGDYGFVGLLICFEENEQLNIETFLMSCRVLGKRVEQAMMRWIAEQARDRGLARIAVQCRVTEKNQPLRQFFTALGLEVDDESQDLQTFLMDLNAIEESIAASTKNVIVSDILPETSTASVSKSRDRAMCLSPALQKIAEVGGETKVILAAIRGQATLRRGELKTAFIAPRTAWQKKISAIWCEVLQIDRVGIYDSFFELGGDSLKAAEVFARMWELGAPESISLVNIPEPTVAVVCQAIEDVKAGRTPTLVADLVSLEEEGKVPDDILHEAYDPTTYDAPMRRVFMTGATGYLGAFLLAELMEQTEVTVNCLVRASTGSEGRRRVQGNLERYGIWQDEYAHRIDITLGELTEPQFGLSVEEFSGLAREIDTIFHSGAWVNFVFPYERLKPAHVDALETVMRLAVAAKPKPIALHFISTLGVIMSTGYGEDEVVSEDGRLQHVEGLLNGYEQAKHVADKMAWTGMTERGIPTAIYRPGMVGGHSETGEYHKVDEFLSSFYKGCIQLGSWPLLNTTWEVVPVDYVCRAIVHGAKDPKNLNHAYFTLHPEPTPVADYIRWFQEFGYSIRALPWEVWKKELLSQGTEKLRENALFPYVDFIRALYEEQVRFPATDRSNFNRLTDAAGLKCPGQLTVLERYMRYFIKKGYVPSPPNQAAVASVVPLEPVSAT